MKAIDLAGDKASADNSSSTGKAQNETNSPPQLHVLDLPALYTRPEGNLLLEILEQLTLQPASFASPSSVADRRAEASIDEAGVPRYLTTIVSSSLSWIDDEDLREEIWEKASRRLAERAGRSAVSSLTRSFTLPARSEHVTSKTIAIHEPTLTADNLGHKTWSSSYVLSLKLLDLDRFIPVCKEPRKVLELGSGTGLFGISFAALFPASEVVLTDLPEIVPNLRDNIEANASLAEEINSCLSAEDLDWNTCPSVSEPPPSTPSFDIVLAADPIYSPIHPGLVTRAVNANLRRSPDARLILGLPIREAYLPQIEELWKRLADLGLSILEQGQEECTDDWVDRHGELVKVTVRWAVWACSE